MKTHRSLLWRFCCPAMTPLYFSYLVLWLLGICSEMFLCWSWYDCWHGFLVVNWHHLNLPTLWNPLTFPLFWQHFLDIPIRHVQHLTCTSRIRLPGIAGLKCASNKRLLQESRVILSEMIKTLIVLLSLDLASAHLTESGLAGCHVVFLVVPPLCHFNSFLQHVTTAYTVLIKRQDTLTW